jgi:F420-dependent oxidoreductase-like protein
MPLKFGVHFEPLFGFDYKTIEEIALNAEELGYDSLWTCDHFFRDRDAVTRNSLEAWTLLTALAAKTSKPKLGVLVSCNSYRHPTLLAKMAATVDMISAGRLILGIGAGWKEAEYDAYGFRFAPVGERMDCLEEALRAIIQLFTSDRATFDGEYYQLRNAPFAPKPVQTPYPPILIGGHGEKRTLRLVAKYGDMSNFSPWAADRIDRLLNALRGHCEDIGRDYHTITKTYLGYCLISENAQDIREFNQQQTNEQEISVESYLDKQSKLPGAWAGSPEEVRRQYQYLIDRGFSHFQLLFPYGRELEMSEQFAKEVRPKLSY